MVVFENVQIYLFLILAILVSCNGYLFKGKLNTALIKLETYYWQCEEMYTKDGCDVTPGSHGNQTKDASWTSLYSKLHDFNIGKSILLLQYLILPSHKSYAAIFK